jgi:hypothetical protein
MRATPQGHVVLGRYAAARAAVESCSGALTGRGSSAMADRSGKQTIQRKPIGQVDGDALLKLGNDPERPACWADQSSHASISRRRTLSIVANGARQS